MDETVSRERNQQIEMKNGTGTERREEEREKSDKNGAKKEIKFN